MSLISIVCVVAIILNTAESLENLDCTENECNSLIYDYHFPNLTSVVDSTFILIRDIGLMCTGPYRPQPNYCQWALNYNATLTCINVIDDLKNSTVDINDSESPIKISLGGIGYDYVFFHIRGSTEAPVYASFQIYGGCS